MLKLKITICTIDAAVYDELTKQFDKSEYPDITVIKQDIRKCPAHDCIVSPANSFGIMDGGIDEYISQLLAQDGDKEYIMKKVQEEIVHDYYGEQPIGTCVLLNTGNEKFPHLAHAPTMRIPGNVKDTENAYTAFSAVLTAISKHNENHHTPIKSLLTTTFCTGTGRMPTSRAIAQMKAAHDRIYMFQKCERDSLDWGYASLVNQLVVSTRFK